MDDQAKLAVLDKIQELMESLDGDGLADALKPKDPTTPDLLADPKPSPAMPGGDAEDAADGADDEAAEGEDPTDDLKKLSLLAKAGKA